MLLVLFSVLTLDRSMAQPSDNNPSPFLGWNSYDCYGTSADANDLWENLEVFIQRLKPSGYERMDNFSYAQKKTFITQRALAASPLFMGGALPSSPNIVFELITNNDMLECNQNGITGKLQFRKNDWASDIYVWRAPQRNNPSQRAKRPIEIIGGRA